MHFAFVCKLRPRADKGVEERDTGRLYRCETDTMRTAVKAEERELRIGKAQRGIR